jgi:CRP-like cAMP-binding protein/SAM-dependent methyltransferase
MQPALGLLNELSEEYIDWLFRIGFERQVVTHTVIVREDEPVGSLYIVLEGLFAVKVSSIPDSEIGRLGPGEIIGEIAFLENSVPSASVIAIENSLLLEVPSAILAERLRAVPSFGAQFYRALALLNSRRLRERVYSLNRTFQAKLNAPDWSGETPKALLCGVERFKSLLLEADAEAIKSSSQISEATALNLEKAFLDLCRLTHATIGDSSDESPLVKAEMGVRLQREILPFMLLTETAERFYAKPRGYPGDFRSIDMIYQNYPAGTGRIGPLVDRCFLNLPSVRAVRNRRALLAKEIMKTVREKNGAAHVTSLACGPAGEVFDVFEQLDDRARLQASLVDIDLQALAYVADRRDQAKLQNRMNLIHANLVYLAMGRQKLDLKDQDLIYSIGLIDYFNDKFVVKLLNWIHPRLQPGGIVILGNFHPNNYCKEMMDYVMEWKLIHRSEEDINRLFIASAFGRPSRRIQFESEGLNLFAECVKESRLPR